MSHDREASTEDAVAGALRGRLDRDGYVVVERVVDQATLAVIDDHLARVSYARAGTRSLLGLSWCAGLAARLRARPALGALIPSDYAAVQCTVFRKTLEKNWLVRLHRDRSFPVRAKVASPAWTGWAEKEGVVFARPPSAVVTSLLAVRLHLDDAGPDSGGLEVVPGSHRSAATTGSRVPCPVHRGGALVMRPRLLHASSRLARGRRTVLHFVFGPRELPDGVEWHHRVG